MSFRRAPLVFTAMLALVGVVLACALIVLTTSLYRGAHRIREGAEGSWVGQEVELGLIALRDARDDATRDASEDFLHRQLGNAEPYVDTLRERAVLATMTHNVDGYIAVVKTSGADALPAFQAAVIATRAWMRINTEQGRAVEIIETPWDRIATLGSLAAVSLIALALATAAWWTRRRVLVPTLGLVGVIERYAEGDRNIRAPEQGARELRTLAREFNAMATTAEHQRTGQLTFLAGVAHDLRNPLAALRLAVGMVPPERPLPPESRIRALLARIGRQLERLDRMVYDLLDAARVQAGTLELVAEDVDVRDLVRSTVDLFEPTLQSHRLFVGLPDEPVTVRCDPMRIEQVLSNLIGNAIKYSSEHSLVMISVQRHPEYVAIAITDQGPGLSPDDIAHAFEPFYRLGATTEVLPGIGLGLFVSRKIARAHGGDVVVENGPGNGATFTLRLPVDETGAVRTTA